MGIWMRVSGGNEHWSESRLRANGDGSRVQMMTEDGRDNVVGKTGQTGCDVIKDEGWVSPSCNVRTNTRLQTRSLRTLSIRSPPRKSNRYPGERGREREREKERERERESACVRVYVCVYV